MSARILPLATVACLLSACGDYQIDVHERRDGTFGYAEMPDGKVCRDYAAYEKAATQLASEAAEADDSVSVRFLYDEKDVTAPNDTSAGDDASVAADPGSPQNLGPYYLPYGYVYTSGPIQRNYYVRGCVSQLADWEYSIRMNRNSSQVFDVHLAIYRRNGQRCFGIYESVIRSMNSCTCGNPFTRDRIHQAIYAVALGAGLYASVAWLAADVATPIAMGALVLAL